MNFPDPATDVMSVAEAAEYLGTTKNSLYQHKDNSLWPPYHKFGPRHIYYLKSEIDQWISLSVRMAKKDEQGDIYDKRSLIYKTLCALI